MNHINKILLGLFLAVSLFCSGCIEIVNPHEKLPPGMWRGVLFPDKEWVGSEATPEEDILSGKIKFETVASGEIPFNFEVVYDDPQNFHILIYNADEVIKLTDITYGVDRRTAKDTLTIEFPLYNSRIKAIFEENVMEGEWIFMDKENYAIPFAAFYGKNYRFTELKKQPDADITGTWQVSFGADGDAPWPAIGEFKQEENRVTGTFLMETGDYRFLEGTIQGNKMYLSTFDGAVAYLFEAKLFSRDSMQGIFRSGKHFKTTWEAVRSDIFQLSDPDKITTPSGTSMDFTFPGMDGKPFSLRQEGLHNKAKVIQVMGSWCRNCMDETLLLKDLYTQYKEDGLEIIALAFERPNKDTVAAMQRLQRYAERLEIPYPVLLAALSTDKEVASGLLPALDKVIAFPTTIYLKPDNSIYKVHTGIYGPASERYTEYKASVEQTIREILPNNSTER